MVNNLDSLERLILTDGQEELLDLTVELAAVELAARLARIVTRDGEHGRLRRECLDGELRVADSLLPLDRSISGWVIRGGRPYRSDDVASIPALIAGIEFGSDGRTPTTLLSAPVRAKSGKVLAALTVGDRQDGLAFSHADQARLAALAGHVGLALERARLLADLRENEKRLNAILTNTPEIVTILESDGRIRYEGPSLERLTGVRGEDLVGLVATEVVHPEDVGRLRHFFARVLSEQVVQEPIEYRVQYRDGSWQYLEGIIRNLLDDPSLHGLLICSHDVTERKRYEEQLIRNAFADPITRLPNRALYMDRLTHALDAYGRRRDGVAVMLVEFDELQELFERLGVFFEEDLLSSLAERLRECLRLGDTVARFPAGQFALLFEDVDDAPGAARIAERLQSGFERPLNVDGRDLMLTPRMGIALARLGSTRSGDLLGEAEAALNRARIAGAARFAVFEAEMGPLAVPRNGLEDELRGAVERDELVLHYHPEVPARPANGRCIQTRAAHWS